MSSSQGAVRALDAEHLLSSPYELPRQVKWGGTGILFAFIAAFPIIFHGSCSSL